MLPVYRPFLHDLIDETFSRVPSFRTPFTSRSEVFSSHEDDNSLEFRTFIPKSVDPESIEVVLKDGVLTIRMTKQQVESFRKIQVKHE